ncbi:WecB/TagA/CpsF family glycosyltransferase [Candidatus Margulisiibacteriota bacterium]
MNTVEMFGMKINKLNIEDAVQEIVRRAGLAEKTYLVTPNVDHVLRYQADQKFRKVYKSAGLVLADGYPVVWASRLLRKPLPERVAGSDLLGKICAAGQGKMSVFFLGGSRKTPEKLVNKFQEKYPRLKIAGAYSPPKKELRDTVGVKKIVKLINDSGADLLFVGLGSPKQEYFIYDNWQELNVKLAMGVGIALDYSAGLMPRAPVWLRNIGLEWLYRLIREPFRLFWRYFKALFFFPLLVVKEFFRRT